MGRTRRIVAGVALGATLCAAAVARPATLPSLELEDQRGDALEIGGTHRVPLVIVYGTRHAIAESVRWGRKVDARLQARNVYVSTTPERDRPVRIVAVAEMGGVPGAVRLLVRRVLRERVPRDFSLWLDWDDRLAALFGAHATLPTVVVVGRAGDVRAVVTGEAEADAWDIVDTAVRDLR